MRAMYRRDVSVYSHEDVTDMSLAEVFQMVREGTACIIDNDTEYLDNPQDTESEWKLDHIEEFLSGQDSSDDVEYGLDVSEDDDIPDAYERETLYRHAGFEEDT